MKPQAFLGGGGGGGITLVFRVLTLFLGLHVVTNVRVFPSSASLVRCRSLQSSAPKLKVQDGMGRLGAH